MPELWVLEWSFAQRALHLRPGAEAQPWYPGSDWQPLAVGPAAALEELARELAGWWL